MHARIKAILALTALMFMLLTGSALAWVGPTGLSAPSKTTTSITYTWNAYSPVPAGKTGVRRYNIQYRAVGSPTWTTLDTANGSGATTLTPTGLSPGTAYEAQVRARFEPDGATSDYAPITPLQTTTTAAVTCSKYAATTGLDTNAGTSAAPYKTVQKLVDNVPAFGTGCLKAGTYTDGGATYVARITRDDFTLRNDPGAAVTVKGTFYIVNGADRVKVTDLKLDGRPTTGVAPSPQVMATDSEFRRDEITNPTDICAIVGNTGGFGRALRPIFDDNDFHDCGSDIQLDHGIYLEAVDNAQVTNNTFLRSAAYAVHMYPDADGTTVSGNIMDDNGGGAIFAGEGTLASSNNSVTGNTIINSNGKPGIESFWGGTAVGTGNTANNNCLDNNPAGDIVNNGGFTTSGNTFGPC